MEKMYINQLMDGLKEYSKVDGATVADQAELIINRHALAAAAAATAAGWVPGVGSTICTTISVSFVWSMYYRLANLFQIRISKNILKTVASAIVAETVCYIGGQVVAMAISSLIPGLGSVSSAIIGATLSCTLVYACGEIFIYMLTEILKAKKDLKENTLANLTEEEWEEIAKKVMDKVDMDSLIKEGMKFYKKEKKNKVYNDLGDVEMMEE